MGLLGGRFGTVDKAAFLIGKKQKDDGTWEYEKPVEVLINPATLRIGATTQVKKDEGVANEKTPATAAADGKITPKGVTEQQVDMTLIFSLVDEYNAKTQGAEFKALVTAATSGKMAMGVRLKPGMSHISMPKNMVLKLRISSTMSAGMMSGLMTAPLWMAWISAVCMVEVLAVARPMASQAAWTASLETPKM